MTTDDIHLLTGAYVLDALDDADRAVFDRHLATCASCAAEVAELREAAARLADDTWSVPPPRLRAHVLSRVRQTRQTPPRRPPAPRWRHRTTAMLAAAAAVLVLLTAGVTWAIQDFRVRPAERIEKVLSAPDATVRVSAITGGGKMTVVMSPANDAAVVVVSDATDPGTGKAYELWMIQGEHQQPALTMAAGATSTTRYLDGIRGTDVLGMTVEPAGGSAKPTLPMVAQVPMT
ncbi:anti-sigma factor [Hamadaea tsunoensis]|uniref:anti-sigma factor n=1 Tax=Hamadaea tsunoensis TaxID=53368 RepID=UPI000427172B|nr:anti-sigma factor [Hamadaea tsunoensis]